MTNKLGNLSALPVHGGAPPRAADYQIMVDGLVRKPRTMRPFDLAAMPQADVTDDFRCREGWCVPGLHWQGVLLGTLLDAVGADPAAGCVQISAGSFSTPLTQVEARGALLALRLADAPLSAEHGGPVRLIIPGADCYTSVKWVDHIEVRAAAAANTAREIALARLTPRP